MLPLPANDQRQTRARDISHGSSPAAGVNQSQDRSAMCRAGFLGVDAPTNRRGLRALGIMNSHRLVPLASRGRMYRFDSILLPVEQGIRPTHHMQRRGSRPVAAHILPSQQSSQAVADIGHSRRRLSCRSSFAGSRNASKRRQEIGKVIHARGIITQGRRRND